MRIIIIVPIVKHKILKPAKTFTGIRPPLGDEEDIVPIAMNEIPPITPKAEATIPRTDKKVENPIKFNPKPNFDNLILSTES